MSWTCGLYLTFIIVMLRSISYYIAPTPTRPANTAIGRTFTLKASSILEVLNVTNLQVSIAFIDGTEVIVEIILFECSTVPVITFNHVSHFGTALF